MAQKNALRTIKPRIFTSPFQAEETIGHLEPHTRPHGVTWTQPTPTDPTRWLVCLMDDKGRRYILGEKRTWIPELSLSPGQKFRR